MKSSILNSIAIIVLAIGLFSANQKIQELERNVGELIEIISN